MTREHLYVAIMLPIMLTSTQVIFTEAEGRPARSGGVRIAEKICPLIAQSNFLIPAAIACGFESFKK